MSASLIHPVAQKMLQAPGIYIVGNAGNKETCCIIYSTLDGRLIVMQMDKELDPTRFNDDAEIKYGPMLP